MQATDYNDMIVVSKTGEKEALEKEAEELRMRENIKKVVVANLPKLGQEVTINGLKFVVKAEHSRNRFVIQLL